MRVQIFNQIRDIPYSIPLSKDDAANSCAGKCIKLKKLFEKEAIECRFRVCDFNWNDLPLPKKIRDIPHDDASMHVYLEVLIEDEWIDIDPTWDNGIAHLLPVNKWDGKTSTPIAVPVLKKYDNKTSNSIMSGTIDKVKDAIERNKTFYKAINTWLKKERNV